MEVRILGPLELWADGTQLALGGAKQRAVLAALLLRAEEVVPVHRLVDEVWGNDPPPSAAHTLESYVSRLRQLLNGHGPRLVRRGAGYVIELGDATFDARVFVDLQERAALAAAMNAHAEVVELTAAGLAMWRGPALADVALASAGRAEADRLEELRLRTYELRFDADLALGRHEQEVSELRAAVAQSPYRERFVAQLMLALYRSGRHAEALEIYERLRRRLDEDLGLQPSAELQQLSGRIVRQDSRLQRPVPATREALPPRRSGRLATLVAGGLAVAAAMTLTASGGAPALRTAPEAPLANRIALVLPRSPEAALDDPRIRVTVGAFESAIDSWRLRGEILVADEVDPAPSEIEATVRRIEDAEFGLVVVLGGGATARALGPVVRRMEETRFVFVDASLAELSLDRVRNATGMPFSDQQIGLLAGYVSGLVPPLAAAASTERADVVSIVVSRHLPRIERIVEGFERGVRRSLNSAIVLVDYVENERDKTTCERIANNQVDAGSDVVYAAAGACSSSVLAVAKFRGVWGIRANDDDVADGPHILATTYKRWDNAIAGSVGRFVLERLPAGRDDPLTLADDYAVDMWGGPSPEVAAAWSKVVRLCSELRARSESSS